jgi:enoyl-CoA hydratase
MRSWFSPMADEPLVLRSETPWGVRLTLNRPAKLNAISHDLRVALDDAVAAATADDRVRVIVLAGAGRAFCSGYDLSEGQPPHTWGWRQVLAEDVASTLAVWRCPKPVIAQVHGYALAGGLELAMACDLIVAAEGTQLGEPEIRFGSAPVTLLMPFLIGQKLTRELLLTGDLIGADRAERIGLVNRVVPADRLEAEVDLLADKLARVPDDVMAPTKLMLNRAMEVAGFLDAVEAGLDLQSIVNMSETSRAFDAIVRRDGMKAALAWRDQRYDERLADSARAEAAVEGSAVSEPRPGAARGPAPGRPGTDAAP